MEAARLEAEKRRAAMVAKRQAQEQEMAKVGGHLWRMWGDIRKAKGVELRMIAS